MSRVIENMGDASPLKWFKYVSMLEVAWPGLWISRLNSLAWKLNMAVRVFRGSIAVRR